MLSLVVLDAKEKCRELFSSQLNSSAQQQLTPASLKMKKLLYFLSSKHDGGNLSLN